MFSSKYIVILFLLAIISCTIIKDEKATTTSTDGNVSSAINPIKFELLSGAFTGINFQNIIIENEEFNYFNYQAIYQGSGCALLDVNEDGLLDIYFVSSQGQDKLYLNKGKFKFEDITISTGIIENGTWDAGVSVVDINQDGYDDLYISSHLYDEPEKRKNKLWVNQKNNTFKEMANNYGIDDKGYSMHAQFFDADSDGDLDLFVINQPMNASLPSSDQIEIYKTTPIYLYHNGKFKVENNNNSIQNYGFGLSACVADFTNDGNTDLYICNDYDFADRFFVYKPGVGYIDLINQSMRHISQFCMGSDAADINNDGWIDLFTADMASEDRYRIKANMAGMDIKSFWSLVNQGFHYQYMFNALQLNRGNGLYSEIAHLCGISKTDWSWAPLIADFNNDGQKDLYVTNGLKRDVRNKDFLNFTKEFLQIKKNNKTKAQKQYSKLELLNKAPSVKLVNYMYANKGDLNMEAVNKSAGMNHPSFSNGAAYGDLDNDGDLDLIVNNIDDEAFIYENKIEGQNFIRLDLEGEIPNRMSISARAVIYSGTELQMAELNPNKGYMSACESMIHFGIPKGKKVDSLIVRWASGRTIVIQHPKINQIIKLQEKNAKEIRNQIPYPSKQSPYTTEMISESTISINHVENKYDDYAKEILIPHKMSTLGPCLAIADVNGDRLEDFYLGGSSGYNGTLCLQNPDGSFKADGRGFKKTKIQSEDGDVLFYDMEGDGDLDLLVCGGSNEFSIGSDLFQARIYQNNGKGVFSDVTASLLPVVRISASVVKAFDIDGDLDIDLFIGGRQTPGQYGKNCASKILIYNKGKYEDQTHILCPEMNGEFGMVTAAWYNDIDNDRDFDLILTGEWMPIVFMINDGKGHFKNETKAWGLDNTYGWWNCIASVDVNQDGKTDWVCGNLGENIKFKASEEKPFIAYIDDFDANGSWDTYLSSYDQDGKLYPVRGRQCSSEQMPFIKDKFKNFDGFAKASVDEILEGKKGDKTITKKVTEFRSGIFVNQGASFKFIPFPIEAQFSPINDVVIHDFNKDGKMDIAYSGNCYNREIETTRSDAGIGGILLGKGDGTFTPVHSTQTGFNLQGDVRKMKKIKISNLDFILTANNNGRFQMNKIN